MRTIQIDDDVYQALEARVSGFDDTPNLVLRRLLNIDKEHLASNKHSTRIRTLSPGRSRKVDLQELIDHGRLLDGEKLHFRDYKQNRVSGIEATVSGARLVFEGKKYSMSSLAGKIMRKEGYTSWSYRGPLFWFTGVGKSINDLWQEHLSSRNEA